MGRYVRQLEITVTHDGEPITAILKPATIDDVMSLDTSEGEMAKQFRKLLDAYIVELRLTDAAGSPVTKDEFLSVAYFGQAVIAMGAEWLKRAAPQNPSLPGA